MTEVPTSTGRAFVIKYNGYTDVFIYNDEEQLVETGIFDTNFKYSWARLSTGGSVPDEFVLIDGTHLSVGSTVVIDTKTKFAAARRFGNEICAFPRASLHPQCL